MMIYDAENKCRKHPVTTVWELKQQQEQELKGNIVYFNSLVSNEHNIFKFKNSNIWLPTEVPAWVL